MGHVLFVGDKKNPENIVQCYEIVKEVPKLIENYDIL